MKKLLIVLGSLLLISLAVLAALPRLLDVNRYHDRIQSDLQTRLGRPVQLGRMTLSLLPPTFKVQNAVISEDPKYNSGMPFMQTAILDIQLKLRPLLRGDIQVGGLRMVRPQVEFIRGPGGEWNFASLGTHDEQQSKQEQAAGQSKPLQLTRFQIDDATVAITDQQRHSPRTQHTGIDLVLSGFAPGKPFKIEASARLPGPGKQVVKLDGRGGPIEDQTLATTQFEGTLQLDQVSLSDAQQYLNSQAQPGTDASISGLLKFKNDAGKLASTGTVRIDNLVVYGKAMGFPIVLDYNASDDLKADVVQVSETQLKLGSSPFIISGTVDGQSTPPLADLKINAQNVSLSELMKLSEAFGVALSPGMEPNGSLSADLAARGPLSGPALVGTLRVSQLKMSGVMANTLQINLNLAPLDSAPLDTELPRTEPAARGLARTVLVRALTGRVSLNLNDGKLTGIDLAQQLSSIGKFARVGKSSDGATRISELTGDFDLKNGLASTSNLKALTDAGTVAATGTASLLDQELDMKATAVLSKTNSQQVGASAIGGLMTTAMANQNGEIVLAVLVTGTVPNPKVSPDVSTMAKMRLNNLLPSFGNPEQLTEGALNNLARSARGLLGADTGNTPGAAAGNQQQDGNATQNPVSGLAGLFAKKKQPSK
jgi:uncharacterized protein involved in outer membrane biogenesis